MIRQRNTSYVDCTVRSKVVIFVDDTKEYKENPKVPTDKIL